MTDKKELKKQIIKKWLIFFRRLKINDKKPLKVMRDKDRNVQSVRAIARTEIGDVEKLLTIEDYDKEDKVKFIISDLRANPEFMLMIKSETYKDKDGKIKKKKVVMPRVYNWDVDRATSPEV